MSINNLSILYESLYYFVLPICYMHQINNFALECCTCMLCSNNLAFWEKYVFALVVIFIYLVFRSLRLHIYKNYEQPEAHFMKKNFIITLEMVKYDTLQ